jgi:hypothetical protein
VQSSPATGDAIGAGYQLSAYLLDDCDRQTLSAGIPNASILFWPPALSSESLESAIADKFFFFSVASYSLIDIRSGYGFEPYSYLMGGVMRLLDKQLQRLYVIGPVESALAQGTPEEEAKLKELLDNGVLKNAFTVTELVPAINLDLSDEGPSER